MVLDGCAHAVETRIDSRDPTGGCETIRRRGVREGGWPLFPILRGCPDAPGFRPWPASGASFGAPQKCGKTDVPVDGRASRDGWQPSAIRRGVPAVTDPYRILLSEAKRAELLGLVGPGIAPARTLTHARILLKKADRGTGGPGWADTVIAGALDVDPSAVRQVRSQSVTDGLVATRKRTRPDWVYERARSGAPLAPLIAPVGAATSVGVADGSWRLLMDGLVRLEVRRRSPMRRCTRGSNKRVQAAAKRAIAARADHRSRIRVAKGGCAGCVSSSARSESAGRLSRRNQPAHAGRGAPAAARSRPSGAV